MSAPPILVTSAPLISPRGFYYASSLTIEQISDIEKSLAELITFDRTRTKRTSWWVHRKQAVSLAKQCFPLTLGQWMMHQSKNPYLYGRRLEYVFDLLSFIETGQRSLSVHYWYELLEDYPGTTTHSGLTPQTQQVLQRNPWLTRPFPQTLIRWCTYPRGIDDMIWTLMTLFGAEKPDTLGRDINPVSSLHDVKPLPAW